MNRTAHVLLSGLLLSGIVHLSCSENGLLPGEGPGNQSNGRISIVNDENDLGGRIRYYDRDIPIDSSGRGPLAKRANLQAFSLKLVAEVDPPSIDGQVLQATSVALQGEDKAIVSYNMRGEQYLGAVDWFVKLKEMRPVLNSEALFTDSDISAVAFDGNFVYAAEATGAGRFPYPAVLERLKLNNDKFTLEDNKRVPLTSYAGTSVVRTSGEIYATSGDNGHVYRFDKAQLNKLDSVAVDDARWAAWDKDGKRIVVLQGTPGRISVVSEGSTNFLGTFSFPGADVPESKSTVDIAGSKAFIAAGPSGVQIVSINTGKIVGSVPLPDPDRLGLPPSVVVTNSVSVDKDLVFISNGEAGVYVAQGSKEFKDTGSEEDQRITVLGRLQFDALQSVNHVEYEGEYLIVAAGLGGLKIVRVELK